MNSAKLHSHVYLVKKTELDFQTLVNSVTIFILYRAIESWLVQPIMIVYINSHIDTMKRFKLQVPHIISLAVTVPINSSQNIFSVMLVVVSNVMHSIAI